MQLVYFCGYGDWYVEDTDIQGFKRNSFLEHRNFRPGTNTILFPDLNYIPSFKIEGLFRLPSSDEEKLKHTGIFKKENINRLRACLCEGSAFNKLIQDKKCSEDIVDRCFFYIKRNLPSELETNGSLDCFLELKKQSESNNSDIESPLPNKQTSSNRPDSVKKQVTVNSSDETLLKQIGGLALLIAEKHGRYQKGDASPSVKAIADDIDLIIGALPHDTYGLKNSNLRRNITAGIELIINPPIK